MAEAERQGRVADFPILTNTAVGTLWDLGFADATAIWLYQTNGPWVDLIEYLEETRKTSADMAALLHQRPYSYQRHIMPWDVEQQHDGVSRRETFDMLGIQPIEVMRKTDLREQHDAVRRLFPRFRFHKTKCAKGLEALRNYGYEWDEDKQTYKDKPRHDWASHGASAFAQGALEGFNQLGWEDSMVVQPTQMKFNVFSYGR
jgi:hypothetical protein